MTEQITKLTPEIIEGLIAGEEYLTPEFTPTMTVCVLTLRNGFAVLGYSDVVIPSTFDAKRGREVAREKAKQKIWELEGYALKSQLSQPAA